MALRFASALVFQSPAMVLLCLGRAKLLNRELSDEDDEGLKKPKAMIKGNLVVFHLPLWDTQGWVGLTTGHVGVVYSVESV